MIGLRDRALIGLMIYSFARVSAVVGIKVEDYRSTGKRYKVHLHEKGGKFHKLPVHHNAEEYLDAYIEAAGIGNEKKGPLFRPTRGRSGILTGVTAYLESGGTIESTQKIANHRSPRTTKLYDRRGQQMTLDEIERIIL